MSKSITFHIGDETFVAGITKVDRNKVYGYVEEVVKDKDGRACHSGYLLDDGHTIILPGATSLKTVNDANVELVKSSLKTVYTDGTDALLVPSSFEKEIHLESGTLDDLFSLEVNTVYQLQLQDIVMRNVMQKLFDEHMIFRFVFNYRADYEGADAILIHRQNDFFVLTGRMLSFDYLTNVTSIQRLDIDADEQEEDLDFEML